MDMDILLILFVEGQVARTHGCMLFPEGLDDGVKCL